jgi:hypothetical protein
MHWLLFLYLLLRLLHVSALMCHFQGASFTLVSYLKVRNSFVIGMYRCTVDVGVHRILWFRALLCPAERNWVDTRWQQHSTHLHTNGTHNTEVQHTFTHKQYTQYSSTAHIYTQKVHTIQQYSTHLHTNSTQNNTIRQNTQNGTYITIRIDKHNNKNT